MHIFRIILILVYFILPLSLFAQCDDKEYWLIREGSSMSECDNDIIDSIPILCDLSVLDSTCVNHENVLAWSGKTDFEDYCSLGDIISIETSFIAATDYVRIEFTPLECENSNQQGFPCDSMGVKVGIFDITNIDKLCVGLDPVWAKCNCTFEGDSLIAAFNTIPGHRYLIDLLDCWSCDVCNIQILVHEGGGSVATQNPTAILPQASMYSTPDSICQGATDVPFILQPDTIQNSSYLLYIDNVLSGEYASLPILTDWDVPPGNYNVCVKAANYCDTSAVVCTQVTVAEWPDTYFADTICVTDLPYTFMGQNFNSSGQHRVPQSTSAGCTYDAMLTLTIENEPPPTTIDTFICPGNSVTIGGQTFSSGGSYQVTFPSAYGGCDTTVMVNVNLITALIDIDSAFCTSGTFTAYANVTTQPSSGASLTYDWYEQNNGYVYTGNPLQVSSSGTYHLELTLNYGNQSCIFQSNDITINTYDYMPAQADFSAVVDTICSGSSIWWQISPTDNTDSYSWTVPSDVTILEGSDSTAVLLAYDTTGVYSICIKTSNACGDSTVCHNLVVLNAPALSAGKDTIICEHTTTLQASGVTGIWAQYSGPGKTTFSDSSSMNPLVTVDKAGTYSYVYTATGTLCPVSDTVAVTFTDTLSAGSISYICSPATQEYVATVQINGGTAPYNIISGSGSIDTSVYTSPQTSSGDTLTIQIIDSNGCGPLTLLLTKVCDCTTDAGSMRGDTLITCDKTDCFSATPLDEATLDNNDVVQYALHEGSGNSLVNVIAISDDSTFCFTAPMQTGIVYYISRIVGNDDGSGAVDLNDPCLSVAPGQAVLWKTPPTVNIPTSSITSCNTTFTLEGITNGESRSWSMLSGPGTTTFSDKTSDTTTVIVTQRGSYCFALTANILNCSAADTICVRIFDALSADSLEIGCTADNAFYTVQFTINGGDPSGYIVTGDAGTLTGNTFASNPIPTGNTYSFVIENACDTITLQGTHNCNCTSEAGNMQTDTASLCGTGTITIPATTNATLDGNDILLYVLHQGSASAILNPIATSTTPSFVFDGSLMNHDVVYYINAVVGNDDGSGGIDPADICADTSNGTPVIWYSIPDITVKATLQELSCQDSVSTLYTPDSSANLTYFWTSIPPGLPISDPTEASTEISTPGTYQLIATNGTSGCADTATITIDAGDDLPIAEATVSDKITCTDSTVTINATASSQGPQFSYSWSPRAGMTDSSSLQPTVTIPGTYTLIITNTDNGCTAQTSVTVEADTTKPTASATVNGTLTCGDSTITIDATASSQGAEFIYSWSPTAGMTGATTLQPTVSKAGTYTLVVTDTDNGCTAQVSVTVTADSSTIQSADISTIQPLCAGQSNGEIKVNNVTGGTTPYTYILSTGEQNESGTFTGLAAGQYSLTITDANGCSFVSNTINITDPDPLQVQMSASVQIAIGDSAMLSPLILPPMRPIASLIWITDKGDTIPCNPCDSILVKPDHTTTYTLTAIDENGCNAMASVTVVVNKNRRIYIPNAFTPNGDGINDVWKIYPGSENVRIQHLSIYNKWGERVCEVKNIPASSSQAGWDGTFHGQKLNPAVFTYTFVVEFEDGTQVRRSGTVTLLQ